MANILVFIIMLLISYLFGSICSAIVVSKLFDLPDPRSQGSRNPGATNILRLAGKKYAAAVLLFDMLKGFIPIFIGHYMGVSFIILGFACLAAVLGHMYPIFFGFKGGKGVATALGAVLGLNFFMGLVLIALWMVIANFTRYSSLASIITIGFMPLFSIIFLRGSDAFIGLLLITFFILYKHRHNINRLIDGDEPKIKFSKQHDFQDVANEIIIDADILDEEEQRNIPDTPPTQIPDTKPSPITSKIKQQSTVKKNTSPTKKTTKAPKKKISTNASLSETGAAKKKDKPAEK